MVLLAVLLLLGQYDVCNTRHWVVAHTLPLLVSLVCVIAFGDRRLTEMFLLHRFCRKLRVREPVDADADADAGKTGGEGGGLATIAPLPLLIFV